jgi:hypothetical protein
LHGVEVLEGLGQALAAARAPTIWIEPTLSVWWYGTTQASVCEERKLSAKALSYASPPVPRDGMTPGARQRWRKTSALSCDP